MNKENNKITSSVELAGSVLLRNSISQKLRLYSFTLKHKIKIEAELSTVTDCISCLFLSPSP